MFKGHMLWCGERKQGMSHVYNKDHERNGERGLEKEVERLKEASWRRWHLRVIHRWHLR